MALADLWISYYLTNLVLPLVFIFSILTVINNKAPFIRKWLFAHLYGGFISEIIVEASDPFKKKLFSELHNLESKDWQLRNKGLLRIVEIGVGPGANFSFYPKNCHVTCYDPNPNFWDYVFQNYNKNPEFMLERFVVAPGENLVGIEDGSVDAVVTTFVLCSVQDIDVVLSEIWRVLAPGGKYFFMEHQRADSRHWYSLLQRILNPVWYLFTGCELIRSIRKHIENFEGFDDSNVREFVLSDRFPVKEIFGSFIMGTACARDASK